MGTVFGRVQRDDPQRQTISKQSKITRQEAVPPSDLLRGLDVQVLLRMGGQIRSPYFALLSNYSVSADRPVTRE